MRCEFYDLQKWNVHNPFCGNCLGSKFLVFARTRRLGDFGLDRATVEGMDEILAAYDSREGRAALVIAQLWRAASQARAAAAPAPAPAARTYRPHGQSVYESGQRVRVNHDGRELEAIYVRETGNRRDVVVRLVGGEDVPAPAPARRRP